jgi:hypothetical protein
MKQKTTHRFIICIRNAKCEDLVLGKVYRTLPDKVAAQEDLVRIVDESGEDYLYPVGYFLPITLPQSIKRALSKPAHLATA